MRDGPNTLKAMGPSVPRKRTYISVCQRQLKTDPLAARVPHYARARARARGNLARHGVHFLTAYVAGV